MRFGLFFAGMSSALVLGVAARAMAAPVRLAPLATTSTPLPTVATNAKAKRVRLHTGACGRRAWFSH